MDKEFRLPSTLSSLYHITMDFEKIVEDNLFKIEKDYMADVEDRICFTRSKLYLRDEQRFKYVRIIVDRNQLYRYGYKSYPYDEWIFKYKKIIKKEKDFNPVKNPHFIKSNFKETKSGKRQVRHNIKELPIVDGHHPGIEVEYEERIYRDIKNAGKFIYAFNFWNEEEMKSKLLENYSLNFKKLYEFVVKYNIKILVGYIRFQDYTEDYFKLYQEKISNQENKKEIIY